MAMSPEMYGDLRMKVAYMCTNALYSLQALVDTMPVQPNCSGVYNDKVRINVSSTGEQREWLFSATLTEQNAATTAADTALVTGQDVYDT